MQNIITQEDKDSLVEFIQTSNRYTNGPKVEEFENKWSQWLGVKHSLMVSSGSTANYLLLAAVKEKYNLKHGSKVILPSTTWVTNVSPVIQLGMTPIFCDISPDNLGMSIKALDTIKNSHSDISVVFVTHLLGFPVEVEKIKEIFPDAIIIEDVCESHGACSITGKCGSLAEGGTFSFYFGHHMTTIEGGMVSLNNTELFDLMRAKRSHGMLRETRYIDKESYLKENVDLPSDFVFITDGYNFRSTDLNAVIGLSQLKNLDFNITKRRKNFQKFIEIISKYDFLKSDYEMAGNSNYALPFVCDSRTTKESLETHMHDHGFETRCLISGNLLRQPFLREKYGNPDEYINSDYIHFNGFYIGNHQLLNDTDFEYLEKTLSEFSL